MAKPKLCLIPATIGNKVYSILPSDGVGDFDFDRASTATRINAQGLIEEVASGENRLNYSLLDGEVVGCPHLLLEPSRTNLVTYSEDFSQSVWSKQDVTISSNSAISPDGSLNSDLLQETSANSIHYCREVLTVTSGVEYTVSFFAKKKDYDYIQYSRTADGSSYANFNIANGTIGNNSGADILNHQIEDYGNGWYRCIANITTSSTSSGFGITLIQSDVTSRYESYLGDNSRGTYIYGAQVEQGSYPTSYIKTDGSQNTRAAETCNGSGDAATFNDSEGVLMAETKFLVADTRLGISNADNSDQVLFGNANGIFYRITENNANPVTQFIGVSEFENHKIALKYKSTQTSIFVDGFELDTNITSYSLSGLNELALTAQGSNLYGNVKQIQYFDTTDIDLEQLTSWDSFRDMAQAQLYSVE